MLKINDKEFISDFDKVVNKIKTAGELPSKEGIKEDKKLKKGLEWNPKEERVSGLSLSSIKKKIDHKKE